jgi:hypothetical protein
MLGKFGLGWALLRGFLLPGRDFLFGEEVVYYTFSFVFSRWECFFLNILEEFSK